MATHITIHDAHEIVALASGTMSAPISITARKNGAALGDTATFFTSDFELSRKLAEAINATVRDHNAELAAVEAEAA
jgi:hypothetical protein